MNVRSRLSSVSGLLVVALVAGLVAGCGEGSPVEAELTPRGLRVGEVARAVSLTIPRLPVQTSVTIDKNGGILDFGTGTLSFPPGSLSTPTRIAARSDGSHLAVTFAPHGLQFPASARPMLSWRLSGASIPDARLAVAYVSKSGLVLELLDTRVSEADGVAVAAATIDHFSTYIMGAD